MLRSKKFVRLKTPEKILPKSYDFPSFADDRNLETYKNFEAQARKAVNSKKIFYLVGGFEKIRTALIMRGWIERSDQTYKYLTEKVICESKVMSSNNNNNIFFPEKMICESKGDFDKTRQILSYLVKNNIVSMIWGPKYLYCVPRSTINHYRNRIHRTRVSDFCLKEGLHNIAENIQWNTVEDFSELNYPRSFLLLNENQRNVFSNEFQKTMLTSFIFYLHNIQDLKYLFSSDGFVEVDLIFDVLKRLQHLIKHKKHLCIDEENSTASAHQFSLGHQIDLVMREKNKIRSPEDLTMLFIEKLKFKISLIVSQILTNWPDSKYDATNNIW